MESELLFFFHFLSQLASLDLLLVLSCLGHLASVAEFDLLLGNFRLSFLPPLLVFKNFLLFRVLNQLPLSIVDLFLTTSHVDFNALMHGNAWLIHLIIHVSGAD